MIFLRIINNFLTKKLQFDYIQLICIVLSNTKSAFFRFGKKEYMV